MSSSIKNKNNKYKSSFITLYRLFGYFKGYRFLLILVILLVIYTSFAQIYGTYMLKDIISLGFEKGDFNYIIIHTSMMLIIYTLGALANFSYTQIMVRLSQKVIYRIRKDLNKKILALPLSYFDKHQVGELMNYFTNDVDSTINALNVSFANIVFSLCNIIGTMLGMFMLDIYLSLIALFIISIIVVFITINSYKCRKYYRAQQNALQKLNGVIEEDIRGIKVNKAFEHEDDSFIKFDEKNKVWKKAATSAFFHTMLNTPFIVSLSYLNFAICSIIGVLFLVNGIIPSIGTLSPLLIYVRQSAQPFNFFTVHFNTILTALAGAERIFTFLDVEEENVKDKGKIELIKNSDNKYYWQKEDKTLIPLKGDIIFDHVSFSYDGKNKVLNDVSFYAKYGQKIAFVGSTGAGKTTIISLLPRFYDIQEGTITYDGLNIFDIKISSLRRALSIVNQETHLFNDTILNNIKYPRRHSTFNEVEKAAEIGGATHFISKLKDNYETLLYDDAINLSEGERQLVSLSRAAISHPPLLILDEATSNIDTRTEKLIEKSMDELMNERTVLVIAHRLSTVRNSNAILVLEHGKIIERGDHEDLLKQKGRYYSLYKGVVELD